MNKMFRSPLFLMALTIFIDFAGFGLILPLLPFWAEHLGANPTEIGLILTIYALAQFIFTPILGSLWTQTYYYRLIIDRSFLFGLDWLRRITCGLVNSSLYRRHWSFKHWFSSSSCI